MNVTIDLLALATLTNEQFETVAFRLALLGTTTSKPQAPQVERKATPPQADKVEKGPNEIAYLAHIWVDKYGKALPPLQRMRVGQVARPKFEAMGLVTNEEIAAACLAKGKHVGEFFTDEADTPTLPPTLMVDIGEEEEQAAYDNF